MATNADSRRQHLGPKLPWHTKQTLDTRRPSSMSVQRLSHALVRQLNSQSEWSDGPTDRWAPTPIQHVESAEKKQTRTNFSRRRGTHWENLVGWRTKTARWPTVSLVCTGLQMFLFGAPCNLLMRRQIITTFKACQLIKTVNCVLCVNTNYLEPAEMLNCHFQPVITVKKIFFKSINKTKNTGARFTRKYYCSLSTVLQNITFNSVLGYLHLFVINCEIY